MNDPTDAGRQLPDWIAEHLRTYIESRGEEGHIWNGVPTLLLTTRGRKSGKDLTLPLIYGTDGDAHVVVASRGGDDRHPGWYLNLVDEPVVGVRVGTETFTARARTASAEEKARLWPKMAEIWPAYDDYQAKTERDIPVVILERIRG